MGAGILERRCRIADVMQFHKVQGILRTYRKSKFCGGVISVHVSGRSLCFPRPGGRFAPERVTGIKRNSRPECSGMIGLNGPESTFSSSSDKSEAKAPHVKSYSCKSFAYGLMRVPMQGKTQARVI